MRPATFSALFLVTAVLLVISVACQIFLTDFVKPRSIFLAFVASTVLSSTVSLLIDTEIPS